MPLSEKQMKILAFPYTQYETLIMDGAVRTGKTSIGMVAFVDWAMRNYNNTNFIIGGKTVGSARKNIIDPYMQLAYARKRYVMKYRIDGNKLVVRRGNVINTFYVYGGKDESSHTLVVGFTAAGCFLDEVIILNQKFFNQCLARCETYPNKKFMFSMNADSSRHWFYEEWINKCKQHNALRISFKLYDNPVFTPKMIEDAEKRYSGVFYDRYIKGLWVAAEGAIYAEFANNKEKYFTSKPEYDWIDIGVDFGGNKSSFAFVATGKTYDFLKLTALASKKISAADIDPIKMENELNDFISFVSQKYCKSNTRTKIYIRNMWPDSAETTLINGIKTRVAPNWPNTKVSNARKYPVIDRIRATTSLIAQERFYYTEDCQTLVDAMCTAVYDPKQFKDTRLDNGTSDIDTLDSFEYSFERYIKKLVKYVEWEEDYADLI